MYESTKKYFAKVLFTYSNKAPIFQTVLRTFGKDEHDAEINVSNLIQYWPDVAKYSIVRISERPIKLESYTIKVVLKYSKDAKTINLRLNLEDENDAYPSIKLLFEEWKQKNFTIIKIQKNERKN